MAARERFDIEIIAIQNELLKLCNQSIGALEQSFSAFIQKDLMKAQEVIEQDISINRIEEEINDRIMIVLTRHQPVAKDLRRLIILLKIASDMERVGDYAVNIVKETLHIGTERFITSVELIEDMSFKTTFMLKEVVEAFVEENITKAKEIAKYDDQIDEMYGSMMKRLMRLSSVSPESIAQITNLSFVCHHLERCADYATNIAEHLIYLKRGQHFDLNL